MHVTNSRHLHSTKTKSCVSFISLFPYVITKDKPFSFCHDWWIEIWSSLPIACMYTRYSTIFCTEPPNCLTKKGQKTDPSCFMNRSNLSSDARILVERFKIIHIQNLPLQKTSLVPLLIPPRNTCKKNAVVTREEDTKIGRQSSKSTRQSVTL